MASSVAKTESSESAKKVAEKPAAPVTGYDAALQFAVGTFGGIGFWRVFRPFVEFHTHAHSPVIMFPILKWLLPAIFTPLYVLMVFYHKRVRMQKKPEDAPAINPGLWLARWNLFLTILSYIMMTGLLEGMYDGYMKQPELGFLTFLCTDEWWDNGVLMFNIWLFTYSKYIELIDTVFHVLKRSEISFLHWYHHTTVLLYTWYMTTFRMSLGSIFATVNSAVHGMMYTYYYHSSVGRQQTYGVWVTRFQLTQMGVGLVSTALWAYFHISDNKQCPSPTELEWPVTLSASVALYGSYFVLFALFYIDRWIKKSKEASARPKGKKE